MCGETHWTSLLRMPTARYSSERTHLNDGGAKSVRLLYGRHEGETIYVVGSGTSMRVFPVAFLADKVTIGLNMAWKNVPVTYGITIHPDLNVPEFMEGEQPRPEITWITTLPKSRKTLTDPQFAHALENFYFFRTDGQPATNKPTDPSNAGRIIDWLRRPTEDYLYIWSSIAQTGANLAANMGAKHIVFVGCDNCALMGNHHGHQQHTRWKGANPDHRYGQYYEGLAEVRSVLRERGVEVVSLTPFLGLDSYVEDFARLCGELDRNPLLQAIDVSPSTRVPLKRRLRDIVYRIAARFGLVEEARQVKRWLIRK